MTITSVKDRIGRIGGSDIFEICFGNWNAVADRYHGEGKARKEDPVADRGTDQEPAGIAMYERREKRPVRREVPDLVHPDYPEFIGHVDGDSGGIVVEIKNRLMLNSEQRDAWGDDGTTQIPLDVYCQVMWYMLLSEAMTSAAFYEEMTVRGLYATAYTVAHVGLVVNGIQDFRVYPIPYDPRQAAKILRQVVTFKEMYLDTHTTPPPRPGCATTAYPKHVEGSTIDASPAVLRDLITVAKMRIWAKECKTAENAARDRVIAAAGTAESIQVASVLYATLRSNGRARPLLTTKALEGLASDEIEDERTADTPDDDGPADD